MAETLLISGLTAVGNGFFIKVIYDTYDTLKNTAIHEYPYLQKVISDLDLKANLQVIESLLHKVYIKKLSKKQSKILENTNLTDKDIESNPNHQIEELLEIMKSSENDNDPLIISFQNVSDMVRKIKEELENIQQIIKTHESKYFYQWRTPDYEDNLKLIINYKKTLDQRVELLIKLLSIE
jgi:hypothetical protein